MYIQSYTLTILRGCHWFRRDRGVYKEHVASECLASKKTHCKIIAEENNYALAA